MGKWQDDFRFDPVRPLINHNNQAVSLFAKRELLNQDIRVENLWQCREVQRILTRQKHNGAWKYPGGGNAHIRSAEDYDQFETYRNLGYLIEQYGMTRKNAAVQKAAEYLFQCQSKEGDFRGIYCNQYSPNYTAGITELLVKAGYESDARVKKVFSWLFSIRQSDGGWAIPFRTRGCNLSTITHRRATIKPDFSKPFSHMVTGVVLRAVASHSLCRNSFEAKTAGKLLLSSLFKKDNYTDRGATYFWTRFTFPFWFTDLLSALDTLSLLQFSKKEPSIARALDWLGKQQAKDGMWKLKILKGKNKDLTMAWLSLAICRVVKRFHENEKNP